MKTLKQFTSMMDRRVRRLADTFGVDAESIIDELGLDGVYIDNGKLVINEQFYTQDVVNRLTDFIPTVTRARAEATKAIKSSTYEDFIGPMPVKITANQIAREVQAKYEVKNAWAEIREKYYEIESALEALGRNDLIDKVGQMGSDFYNEKISYSDLLNFKETILEELDKAF